MKVFIRHIMVEIIYRKDNDNDNAMKVSVLISQLN